MEKLRKPESKSGLGSELLPLREKAEELVNTIKFNVFAVMDKVKLPLSLKKAAIASAVLAIIAGAGCATYSPQQQSYHLPPGLQSYEIPPEELTKQPQINPLDQVSKPVNGVGNIVNGAAVITNDASGTVNLIQSIIENFKDMNKTLGNIGK